MWSWTEKENQISTLLPDVRCGRASRRRAGQVLKHERRGPPSRGPHGEDQEGGPGYRVCRLGISGGLSLWSSGRSEEVCKG